MEYLRKYIKDSLVKQVQESRKLAQDSEEAIPLLEKTNLHEASYIVILRNFWGDEGELSITHQFNGSLEAAIHSAEEEFRTVTNNRSDVQASYTVQIQLGELAFTIPSEYWDHYRQKNKV